VKKTTGFYPCLQVDATGSSTVAQAGGVVLSETVRVSGVDVALRAGLSPWRKPTAVHDPAKVLLDLALTLAMGGDCLADVALLRHQPQVFGRVASDPTVSRTIDTLAADAPAALKAINTARAAAWARVWKLAGVHAPDYEASSARPVVIDLDATLVTSHSEKESAAPTFKRGYGFHPLWAFLDHGPDGSGEPLACLLRPGNAGSNTAADRITVVRDALAQLPAHRRGTRPGRKVLIRTDGAGATHEFVDWLVRQRLSYSIGFGALPGDIANRLALIPTHVWAPAYDADREPREGAWVAEVTDLLDLTAWPIGMRVIVRIERPHPGAQLRLTDHQGHRVTAFATNTVSSGPGQQLADLELRHRQRARAEDRIRCAKDTGLANLPLHDFAQNQVWCAIVALACEITAWMQMLALQGETARRWEPKRLRLRLFSIPAKLVRSGRRRHLRLPAAHPWAQLVLAAITRLRALQAPG
jgi:hypothetical protein